MRESVVCTKEKRTKSFQQENQLHMLFDSHGFKSGLHRQLHTATMKKYLFSLLLFVLANASYGQTFNAYMKAAENAFQQEDYYAAMVYFGQAAQIESDRPEVWYKLGQSAFLFNDFYLADSAYQKVIGLTPEGEQTDAAYWSALSKKSMGQYDKAEELFYEYAAQMSGINDEEAQKAVEAAQDCAWARDLIAQPDQGIIIEEPVPNINTSYSEFGAFTDENGTTYYTSYSNVPKKDEYVPPRPFMRIMRQTAGSAPERYAAINPGDQELIHTAYPCFNTDGSKIYYSICEYTSGLKVRCSIYYRDVFGPDSLGTAIPLPQTINMPEYSASQPAIGLDEASGQEILFFVSNRPGGHGKLDIWYTLLGENNSCSEPQNLSAINTAEDDMTPFFHTPTQTLYFSTKGLKTLGGLDIYRISKSGEEWGQAEHLAYPVNSSFNDAYYTLDEYGLQGFFASNRNGSVKFEDDGTYCCFDIYHFRRTDLKVEVFTFDAKTGQPLAGTTVSLAQLQAGNKLVIKEEHNPDGNDYLFSPSQGYNYVFTATAESYVPTETVLDLRMPPEDQTLRVDIYLPPEGIDFTGLVFEQSEGTPPLPGASLQLFENGEPIDLKTNETGNDFHFPLSRNKTYTIIASKPGYHPDTLELDLTQLGNEFSLEHKFYLKPKTLIEFPPLYIYFDNDQPNPRTYATTTDKSYDELFEAYYARKQKFIQEYTDVLEGRDRYLAQRRVEAFFDREIRDGYATLQAFAERLYLVLQEGTPVKVTIKGYASPRASTEYNDALTSRRIASVENYFKKYRNGVLKPYFESGQIVVEREPYGDRKANPEVSDRLEDERNSIYSPVASIERRVEIIGITLEEN